MKTILVLLSLFIGYSVSANPIVSRVLNTYVTNQGVQYPALKQLGQSTLNEAVQQIVEVTASDFEYLSNEEQISHLINAYNIYTLKSIVEEYPVESIRDIDGVWKKNKHSVLGREMTLDHIEHKLLRVLYEEPRIHMALVCAAKDCPPLRDEAYTADKLEEQLSNQSRAFLSSTRALRVDPEQKRVSLSSIFKWFGEDFAHETGPELEQIKGKERGIMRFVLKYAPEEYKEFLSTGDYKIKYIPYDWKLNEASAP